MDVLTRRRAVQSSIAVIGAATAAGSLAAGVVLGFLASWGTDRPPNGWLVLALVVVAVAAPLYGAVAAAHEPSWRPLALGVGLAAAALLWLCALAEVNLSVPG